MASKLNHKEVTDYFRTNIFEALLAYKAWKMIFYSRSIPMMSKEMAERYVQIQNYHSSFFQTAERAFLINFVLVSLHPFDRTRNSYSLYKVDRKATELFVKNNESVIDALEALRNQLFAHRDSKAVGKKFIIPAPANLDEFFKRLIDFYNELTVTVDGSSTGFINAEEIKHDIEFLFMNLYRGEATRKQGIEIEWAWEKHPKKASDIL